MGFGKYIKNKDDTYGYINEAKFSKSELEKVAVTYGKILGRKLGGPFVVLDTEDFKNDFGTGKGIRTMNNSGAMLRFNYDSSLSKFAGRESYSLTSITYWDSTNREFEKPTMTIVFSPTANVKSILDRVGNALKTGRITETLSEASSKEIKAWLKAKGIPDYLSLPVHKEKLDKRLTKAGLTEEFAIFSGGTEKNSLETGLKKKEKEFENVYADPRYVFDDIEELTKLVATKEWKSLIVCGMGGVGKTFHVKKALNAALGPVNQKWTMHVGAKAAPFSFYKTLFMERDKVILWDEADSILKNDDIIMMLKPALDSDGDHIVEYTSGTTNMVGKSEQEIIDYGNHVEEEIVNGAEITMGKEKSGQVRLPSKFKFSGSMVFISNMPADKVEQAVMSRSIFVDVYLAAQDAEFRVNQILDITAASDPNVTEEDVAEVMEALGASAPSNGKVKYMSPEYARQSKKITVRSGLLGLKMKKAGLNNWKRLIALYA